MKRILNLLIAVVFLAGSAGFTTSAAYANIITGTSRDAAQASSTITVPAAADARVLSASPTTNHGSVSRLDVDDPGEHSYLRFNVSGVTGPVTSAVLRLYVTNGSSNGPSLYPTSSDWSETTITWNNKPAATGGAAANLGAISSGGWVDLNITTIMTGDGSYDFVLQPDSTDGASFYSREGSSPPQLVVTFNTGPAPTPTNTATPTEFIPPTQTATSTNTSTPTETGVPTTTFTPTQTSEPTQTFTPTNTPTVTNTPTRTSTATITSTPTSTLAPTTPPAFTTITVPAAADARVLSASPTTNYGTVNRLDVDSPGENSYIRFTVSGVTGAVTNAKLRLYVTNGSSNGPSVYLTSNTWGENTITWNNKPAATSGVLANVGNITSSTWAEFDLTSTVTGNGSYDFAILPDSTDGASFYSREGTASFRPQLVINFGSGPAPTPTNTTTAGPTSTPTFLPTVANTPTATNPPSGESVVFVGAGDIADCSRNGDEQTALLLDNIPGTVFTVGDNAYPSGSATNYNNCYNPSWGRHKNRTRPAVGDNEYGTTGASGYFGYFGSAAGPAGKGWYSYNLGNWHIIVLNSECSRVGGCDADSEQGQWLAADLAANPSTCTLAIFHEPLFSSNGGDSDHVDFWEPLYAAGAEIVLSGHRHNYERFAPQTPAGVLDNQRGIRQFIVGTGGSSLSSFGSRVAPNSQVRSASANGVLKLTLHPTSYDWEFIPVAGQTFSDSGSAQCSP